MILPIHIGMDFNVRKMCAYCSFLIEKSGRRKLYTFQEYHNYTDTPELIEVIKYDFPENKIIVYPDASGKKNGSIDAGVSDHALIRKAGFSLRSRSKNPFIKDRVAAVNAAFWRGDLLIDTNRCPFLYEALTSQVYDAKGLPVKDGEYDNPLDAYGYKVSYLMPVRELSIKSKTVAQ